MWDTALGHARQRRRDAHPGDADPAGRRSPPPCPARAGLFNLGGEGQLLMGAIGAIVMADLLDGNAPGFAHPASSWALGGAAFGAAWAALPAVLKVVTRTNEAISSLLLNYIAGIIVTWLCFEPWKDPASLGQAYSRELERRRALPRHLGRAGPPRHLRGARRRRDPVGGPQVHDLGLQAQGHRRQPVGGPPGRPGRRAACPSPPCASAARMAGLGGMIEVAGTEGRLRPELLAGVRLHRLPRLLARPSTTPSSASSRPSSSAPSPWAAAA